MTLLQYSQILKQTSLYFYVFINFISFFQNLDMLLKADQEKNQERYQKAHEISDFQKLQ